jgi:hypothetical protein
MECINGMMNQLGRAPRSLLDPNDHYNDLRNSHEFRVSVAHVWDPLRRRMEMEEHNLEDDDLEDVDLTLPAWMNRRDNARVAANVRNLQEE